MTSKQNMRVGVCVSVCLSLSLCASVAASEEIDIHNTLADTMSLNDWFNFFASDVNDSDFEEF